MLIEKIILDHLGGRLLVPVYTEMPANPPSKFVLIEKTGSRRSNLIDHATIAIQSYGNTLLESANLNEAVKASMYEIVEESNVSSCELNSDYNFTDTTLKRYRYQAVFDVCFFS